MSKVVFDEKLPVNWFYANLGDIRINQSRTIIPNKSKNKIFELYSIPSYVDNKPEIITGSKIKSNKQIIDTETVLLSKINPHINRVWITSVNPAHEQIASTEWISFFKQNGIYQKYLLYFLKNEHFRQFLLLNTTGVGGSLTRINPTILNQYKIPIPPFAEQKRIVTRIEKSFHEIDSSKKNLNQIKILIKEFKQSILKQAFEGKLISQNPDDLPALDLETHSAILPKGWVSCKMRDVVSEPKQDIVDGPFGSNLKSNEYVDHGIPLIRLQNVDRNNFINKNIRYITKEKAEQLKRHSFLKNDLVITKLGAPVGKAALVPEYLDHGIIIADILRMRVSEKIISGKFLMYLINSDVIIKQFHQHTKGTTRPRVNLTKFRDFFIPLPPVNEQKRIVKKIDIYFETMEKNEIMVNSLLQQLDQIEFSILKYAFNGKLMPQNLNEKYDESLFDQIQEKEKLKQNPLKRSKNVK
jgi:type I restriction enzyme, S subunit